MALRDVTPEAVMEIATRLLPGFGEAMRMESLKITKNAILSRNVAVVVEKTLVICLPGKPSGAVELPGIRIGSDTALRRGIAGIWYRPVANFVRETIFKLNCFRGKEYEAGAGLVFVGSFDGRRLREQIQANAQARAAYLQGKILKTKISRYNRSVRSYS